MELDDKMIMELASQMGLTNGKKIDMNKVCLLYTSNQKRRFYKDKDWGRNKADQWGRNYPWEELQTHYWNCSRQDSY